MKLTPSSIYSLLVFHVYATQFYITVDVCTFFKYLITFSLPIETDEWAGLVTALQVEPLWRYVQ